MGKLYEEQDSPTKFGMGRNAVSRTISAVISFRWEVWIGLVSTFPGNGRLGEVLLHGLEVRIGSARRQRNEEMPQSAFRAMSFPMALEGHRTGEAENTARWSAKADMGDLDAQELSIGV